MQAHWRAKLTESQLGRPGIAGPPESPGALCNHLCIVVALGEEGQTDLTPEPGRHDDDDLRARSVAKAEGAADDLVELIEQMQLHAIARTEYPVLDEEIAILVRRREHHHVVDLPADVVVEALCLIWRDPVLVSLVADDDRIAAGSDDLLMNVADPLPIRLVFP